jgi:SAM-dependent methyltransferase
LDYIHGTQPDEQARLSRLNDLLNPKCLDEMDLAVGSKILDVGSGLGQFTRLMARRCAGSALGIERSREQLDYAKQLSKPDDRVEFREGDAYTLPLSPDERGTFDIAHARFILEHVEEPLRVVHQMVQAVKPRGRIVLMDDDHDLLRLYPEVPEFDALWNAYVETYRDLGNDPFIGRKLPDLIHRAGALPLRTTLIFFGGCKGQPEFEVLSDNMVGLIEGAAQSMLQFGRVSESQQEEGLAAFHRWRGLQSANMVFGLPWAEGIKL